MAVTTEAPAPSKEQLLEMYRQMWEIRRFDSRALELYREGLMRGTTHPYIGMEAVGVGVCSVLENEDTITSTHRGHGHCIAKGGDIKQMMAELLGKETGYCRGKGGSMHIADVDRGILGANGIVGGGIGLATGSALSAQILKSKHVSVCFFGDGALNQGVLHEACNLAAIWKLPVIYVCENNQYAMSSRADRFTSVPDPSIRATAYDIPGENVDGMDVLEVRRVTAEAVERARAGDGPTFIVASTYRFFGHHVGDPLNYRDKSEVDEWRKKDPIAGFKAYLLEQRLLTDAEAERIEQDVVQRVEEAIELAKAAPEPSPDILMEDIYA